MKTLSTFFVTAMCGMLTLSSCSTEDVNNFTGPSTGSGTVRIGTRGDTDTPLQTRLYIFNEAGRCIQQLAPDEHAQFVTTSLTTGTYDLYGIASDELSNFSLPSVEDATPTTEITVAPDKQRSDLLIGHEQITLEDGDHENIDIQLERKVTHVTSMIIHEVPSDVEQVSVSITPIYQKLLLDGTLDDPTGTYTVHLTDLGSGDWEATPDEMILPSMKKPTITITFTKGETTKSYTYAAAQAINANTNVTLEGTFVGQKGIVLTATMTPQSWNTTPQDFTFDFDEYPIASQMYQGYFVVANDPINRTATLLAQGRINFTAPEGNAQADWLPVLNAAMSSYEKPAFASATDHWRLPTAAECAIFSKNTDYVTSFKKETGYSPFFFCLDDTTLKWGMSAKTESGIVFYAESSPYQNVVLRPVIDITY